MILPDYSEYLNKPEMLDWIEKEWIAKPETHDEHARIINEFIYLHGNRILVMIEAGCGTGEIASRLNMKFIPYVGFDRNEKAIKIAEKKCGRKFIVNDIRDFRNDPPLSGSLVFSFAFLKHFGLHEWKEIFNKLASLGDYLIFDMPIAVETKDDGTEYHHIWMSGWDLNKYIEKAGFELLEIKNPDSVEPVFICKRKIL